MFSLKEIFFQPLKSQPNVNTLHVHRHSTTDIQQIFLIGLDGHGAVVEYAQSSSECKTFPISLPEIQSDCRVLSMEILPQSKYSTFPTIVYGYIKTCGIPNSDDCPNYFLDRLQVTENNPKSSTQLRTLSFAPKFMKTIMLKNGTTNENEAILVVAGADKLLFFNERLDRPLHDITKSIESYLPELKSNPGNVCAMDVMFINDPQTNRLKYRLIACGHSDGLLNVYITNVQSDGKKEPVHKSLEYNSFVSTVKFFYYNHKPLADEQPNLLVTSALEPAVIYRNILTNHLNEVFVIRGTDAQDCLTSSCICDIDLDGKNEILLGTFGEVCFICRMPNNHFQEEQIQSIPPNDGLSFVGEIFPVCRALSLAAPAFGVIAVDFTNDGLDEIVIATAKGLHIYQLDLNEVVKLMHNRLENRSIKRSPSNIVMNGS